jgi:phenylpropionate dioxygenase-like ring-hydroxylating dioxygenase large terminal subunit
MFLRNCWYVAGWSQDFAEGAVICRTMLDEPIALYRKGDGGIVALEDRCCHRLAPLSRGRIEGDDLRCMYHGLKFAPSGRCVEIPGQSVIPPKAAVRSYAAVEQDCWIWLWMGDPALADTALIPRALKHGDPNWHMQTGRLAYEANYQLINDNLLDLSHLSYVHENTLGRNSMSWGESRPTIVPIEHGLRISRWVVDNPAPGYLDLPPGTRTDMWASYDYMVPGVFLLATQSFPPGTAAACSMAAPSGEPLFRSMTSQAVTPNHRAADDLLLFRLPAEEPRDRGKFAATDRRLREGLCRGQRDDRGAAAGHRPNATADDAGDPVRQRAQPVSSPDGRADRCGAAEGERRATPFRGGVIIGRHRRVSGYEWPVLVSRLFGSLFSRS